MARHRNVRTMKYEDEFFDEDDVEDCYGQSFDDKYCISPGTAAQFTFSRGANFDLGSYISGETPEGGVPPGPMPEIITPKSPAVKAAEKVQKYADLEEARLNSCLDQVRDVIADLHPREVLVACVKKHNFNCERVLNELLSSSDAPKPQRQPRQGRRGQEFPLDLYAQSGTVSSECDDEDEDDYDCGRDSSKRSLVMAVPQSNNNININKLCQEYNSVGEEECSSYSSLNSGDTDDRVSSLSEQNRNSPGPGHNKIQIMRHLKSGSTSSENVAPSTESSDDGDDDDLEVDGELQSNANDDANDDDVGVEPMSCFPDNTESSIISSNSNVVCKPKEGLEQPNVSTANNRESNDCNMKSNPAKVIPSKVITSKAIPTPSASKFVTPKSDKQELMKLFAMANINKQKMAESANKDDPLSSSPKPSLCEEISRSPIKNQIDVNAILTSAERNSCKTSLADIFQQRHIGPDNNIPDNNIPDNNKGLSIIDKCEECSANQGSLKNVSLADLLAKQRFGSNSQEQVPKIGGGSLSQMISSSSCPNKPKNNLTSVRPCSSNPSSSSKPLIDLTNHRFGKGSNLSALSDKNGLTFPLDGFQSLTSATEQLPSKEVSVEKMIPTDKAALSLADLMKQRSSSHAFQSQKKNFSLTDLCEESKPGDVSRVIGKKSIDVKPGERTVDVERGKNVKDAGHIQESEHSTCSKASQVIGKKTIDVKPGNSCSKAQLDNQKRNSPTEFSNKDFTIICSNPQKDGQPMSSAQSDAQKKDSPRNSPTEFSNDFPIVCSNPPRKACSPMSLGELFSQVNNSTIDLKFDSTSKLEDLWQGPSNKHKTEESPTNSKEKDLETTERTTFLLPSFLNEASIEYQKLKTTYEASASLFGRVVSYHSKTVPKSSEEKAPRKNRYQKFSYTTQMCGLDCNEDDLDTKLSPIVPFDFSTPSPDDIVKKQQSQAFGHKNIVAVE